MRSTLTSVAVAAQRRKISRTRRRASVSSHRAARLARRREAEPEPALGPGPREDDDEAALMSGAVLIRRAKVPTRPDAARPRKRFALRAGGGDVGPCVHGSGRTPRPPLRGDKTRIPGCRLRSGGEALAPFRPPAGEDGPARLGPHPDQEAVGPVPVAVVGLERAFALGHGAQALRRGGGFSGLLSILSTAGPFSGRIRADTIRVPRKTGFAQRWRSCGKADDLGQDPRAPENARGRARVRLVVP